MLLAYVQDANNLTQDFNNYYDYNNGAATIAQHKYLHDGLLVIVNHLNEGLVGITQRS